MTEDAEHAIVNLRENLDQIDGLHHRLVTLTLKGPAPQSMAAQDRELVIGRLVWDMSLTALGTGIDHMATWRATLATAACNGGRVPVYAHFTLLRAAAESAVFARWLCDPEIDHDERLGRALGAQTADEQDRRRLSDLQRRATGALEEEELPPATVAESAQASVTARRVPSVTNLFALYANLSGPLFRAGNGEALYRVLSGIAHGKQWALDALSAAVDPEVPVEAHWSQRMIDVRGASWASFSTMAALGSAVADAERYGGIG